MEITEIAKGRLKVVLNAEELQAFSIDVDQMDYGCPETKNALEGILAVVRAKTDLDTGEGKTYVQLYPSRDGGCEIFLVHTSALDEQSARALVPFKEQPGYLCFFKEKGAAELFWRLLTARGFFQRSLFYDPAGDAYLFYLPYRKEHLLFLEEFGRPVDPSVKGYLCEHFCSMEKL